MNIEDYQKKSNDKISDDFAENIKREINLASTVNDGYKREIELPNKIDGSIKYSVWSLDSTLVIILYST